MNSQPLISVIIPLYNAERYIADTIRSAIDQTWSNKEIIIVDDGSTDNSLAIVRQFENDSVKVFSRSNHGSGSTRNYGLQKAKGEFIQYLDADDLLSINKIEEQVKQLTLNPGKVAVCSTVHFNTNQVPYQQVPTPYEEAFLFDTNNPLDFLIKLYGGEDGRGSMIQTNAWLCPASVLKKAGAWSEFYSPDDDGEYFCRVLLASKGVVYTKACFNYYRKFTDDKSLAGSNTKEAIQGKFKSFLLKKEHMLAVSDNAKVKSALAHSAVELAVHSYTIDKTLYHLIMAEINALGGTSYIPVLGGPKIEFLKKWLGWRVAKSIQHTLRRFDR